MPDVTTFRWDSIQALVGPATVPINISGGTATGGITFPTGATTTHTREIWVGGSTAGNIRCKFLNQTTTSVTIPIIGQRSYPWALTKVFATGTTVTKIWGFY